MGPVASADRRYPVLPAAAPPPTRPISFVTVRYCDDFQHNLLKSDCVHDAFNELVVVDNRGNIFFDNLSAAIQAGLDRVRHDLVVVVHEDVMFLPGWQQRFERSLAELERYDPDWGVLGAVGWTAGGEVQGHWSDPATYCNTLFARPYAEVARIDEQIMVLRRSVIGRLDTRLPSIHWIGWDLPLTARALGRKTYAIDAPTIHKYADAQGRRILSRGDSPKIVARDSLAWRADWACCNDYFVHKWRGLAPNLPAADFAGELDAEAGERIAAPVILLAKGGGGSRLLSVLGEDAGLFLGNRVNGSGDNLELVEAVYKGIIAKYRGGDAWQRGMIVAELRQAAYRMLEQAGFPAAWGFKLPELLLILPELAEAFPRARFVHMVRDPLSTCLRRTHMTARLDNQIGQVTLPLAYSHLGLPVARILDDAPALHMAYTTRHQIESVLAFMRSLPRERRLQLRFEHILRSPAWERERMLGWMAPTVAQGIAIRARAALERMTGRGQAGRLEAAVDPERVVRSAVAYPEDVRARVVEILADLRRGLGYR